MKKKAHVVVTSRECRGNAEKMIRKFMAESEFSISIYKQNLIPIHPVLRNIRDSKHPPLFR